MTLEEIDRYLKIKNQSLDPQIMVSLKQLKSDAVAEFNESLANSIWCYEEIYSIQKKYLKSFELLKKAAVASSKVQGNGEHEETEKEKLYESAWDQLADIEIDICCLERNFHIEGAGLEDFYINKVLDDIKKLQALYPYKLFTSREDIIKQKKCSICGKIVSPRQSCGHIPGRLYNGELCRQEITDIQLLNFNIVTDPLDKYAILKIKGKHFDFPLLDYLIPHITAYSKWSYTIEERLLPKYKKIGRNELCPCGSGLKFKKCISKDKSKHYESHYIFSVGNR